MGSSLVEQIKIEFSVKIVADYYVIAVVANTLLYIP